MQRTLFDMGEPAPRPAKRPLESEITAAKERHPDMVLLFHVGDCYQLFDEDAIVAAELLGLVLTRRGPRSLAGFARRFLEVNLRKLLDAGHRIAVCEYCDSLENKT